jgi:hypothetical protein
LAVLAGAGQNCLGCYLSVSAARENFAQNVLSPLHRTVSRRYDSTPFDENALLRRFPEKFPLTSSK